jgi:hypothetical protein
MKQLFFLISIFAILFGFSACKKKCDDLPAPAGLTIKNTTTTTADLSWEAVSGAASYDIEISVTTLANKTVLSNGNSSTTTFAVTGLTASKSYSAKVTPRCSKTEVSSNSSEVAFSTTALPCDLPAVTNLTTKAFPTSVVVNFKTITGVQSYKVDIYTITVPKVLVKSQIVQQVPTTITGLIPGTAYEVEVAAICTNNNSPSTSTAKRNFITPIIIDDDILMFGSKSPDGNVKFDNVCSVGTNSSLANLTGGSVTIPILSDGIHYIKVTDNTGTGTVVKCEFRLMNHLVGGVMKFCYRANCPDTTTAEEPNKDAPTGILYFDLNTASTQMKINVSGTDFTITIPTGYKLYTESQ